MTENEEKYIIKNKLKCEICGKFTNKSKCGDCVELENQFTILKNTSEKQAKKWLENQLKELKGKNE